MDFTEGQRTVASLGPNSWDLVCHLRHHRKDFTYLNYYMKYCFGRGFGVLGQNDIFRNVFRCFVLFSSHFFVKKMKRGKIERR